MVDKIPATSVLNLSSSAFDLGEVCEEEEGEDDEEESSSSDSDDDTRKRFKSEKEVMREEGHDSSLDGYVSSCLSERSKSFTLASVHMEKFDNRILQLSWICSLKLHGNELVELPESICSLRHLTSLSVTSNKLSFIPHTIGLLSSLKKLDLSHNALIGLPDEVSQLVNLETCILDFNDLSEFPPALFKLPTMANLSLLENFNIHSFAPVERFTVFTKLNLNIDNVPKLMEEWKEVDLPNVEVEWHKVFPDQVLDFLFIGSLRTAQEQRVYDALQIKRVVTCGMGMQVTLGEGMHQLLLGLADTVDANLTGHLQKGIDYLVDAKAKNERVLVHCFAGLSRSASLIVAYLMQENRWTFEKSLDFVKAARPNVCPNEGFVQQLQLFEKQLGISQ